MHDCIGFKVRFPISPDAMCVRMGDSRWIATLLCGGISNCGCGGLEELQGMLQRPHSQKSTTLISNNFRFSVLVTRVVITLFINTKYHF